VDAAEGRARAPSSSAASSTAIEAPRSTAWSYEPAPPPRRATAQRWKSSGDRLGALDAHVEQLSRMSQLMHAIADDAV
jgi:hypothetical protein